jgi:hypothetical protein
MICQKCKDEGLKSKVTSCGGTSTLMWFSSHHDAQGSYHHHDGNTITSSYKCSNGHLFSAKYKKQCPNFDCTWPDEEPVIKYHTK